MNECGCGEPLHGRQQKCPLCAMKEHQGSSQCPFCLEWYWTHLAAKVNQKTLELHQGRKCR
jgi:hypothetical protein